MSPLSSMSNVNDILDDIKKNDTLSRSWRAASSGTGYAPVEGEIWRISPEVPFGSPLGGQTAVKAVVAGVERSFWPSWLVKMYPIPQGTSSNVTLKGHFLDKKQISSIPLEKLLNILTTKDIRVTSIEVVIGLKKTYDSVGSCTGLRQEVVSLYHWETVERQSSATSSNSGKATKTK